MKKRDVYDYDKIEKDLLPVLKKIIANPDIEEIDYKGVDITTPSITATCLNIKESLTKDALEHDREQGRTALQVIFNKIFQMGYQQGEARMIEDYKDSFDLMNRINSKGLIK